MQPPLLQKSNQVPAPWRRRWPLLALAVLAAGCRQELPAVFPTPSPALVWPPPPAPPRIAYVGQLHSDADLKAPPKFLQGLSDLVIGPKKPEELYGPRAVLSTDDGARVWIADPGGRCLHLFDLDRRVYKKVRQVGPTQLVTPVGLCQGPDHSIYVCDSEAIAIHRLTADAGVWLETLRLSEDFARPVAVYYDAPTDELFVVDVAGHDIKVLGRDGSLRRILGGRGWQPGEFNFPCDIAADQWLLWVVDTGNHRVQGLTRGGEPVVSFGRPGDAPGDLALPKSIALDSAGHLYVLDGRFENVQIFDQTGRLLLTVGQEGSGPGQFWLPAGICIDRRDRIWICDTYNARVQVFDYVKQADEPSPASVPEVEPP